MRKLIPILASLAILGSLASQAKSAEFIITIPDSLIEDGAKWHHYDAEPRAESKEQFVLERVLRDSKAFLDSALYMISWTRLKSLEQAGITIEVKD